MVLGGLSSKNKLESSLEREMSPEAGLFSVCSMEIHADGFMPRGF